MRTAKKDSPFYEVFAVYDFDGVTKLSGQTIANNGFALSFYLDGASVVAPTHTVTEEGATGVYVLNVTFPTLGHWVVFISSIDTGTLEEIESFKLEADVTLQDVDGLYAALSGGVGSKTLVVTVKDTVTTLVEAGVLINVWSSDSSVFLTFGKTNSLGQFSFSLDPGTYVFKYYKAGFSVEQGSVVVTSADSQTVAILGTSATISPPSVANACTVYANFVGQDGEPLANFVVAVTNLFDPSAPSGLSVVEKETLHTSNTSGHVEFSAVQGMRVRVSLVSTSIIREFVVPSQGTANLFTLLGESPNMFTVITDGSDPFSIVGIA